MVEDLSKSITRMSYVFLVAIEVCHEELKKGLV